MFKRIFAFLLVFSLLAPVSVGAAEAEPERILYAIAVRGAVRNLPAITQFDDAIDDMVDMRYQLRDLAAHFRRSGTAAEAEVIRIERQIGDLSASISNMRAIQEMTRAVTEFSMRNSITAINNMVLDIELLEATLAHEQVTVDNLELRHRAGLVSESDLRAAQLGLQQRETNLAALTVSLETERQNLNRILQRPVTGNFYVAFEREIIELPADLNRHISRVAHRQPNIRQRDNTLNRARSAQDDRDVPIGSAEHRSRERAVTQAERERTESLRAMEAEIRSLYNNITMLMHTSESLEIDLQRAKERLETVELNYQTGLATRFDVEGARLAVLGNEIALEKNLNTLWSMQFLFENPFIRLMGS